MTLSLTLTLIPLYAFSCDSSVVHQAVIPTLDDIKSSVADVQRLADVTLQQTGVTGQQLIRQEVGSAKDRMNECIQTAEQLRNELNTCLDTWNDVDRSFDDLRKWLKGVEGELQSVELKSSLKQKQNQVDRLTVV